VAEGEVGVVERLGELPGEVQLPRPRHSLVDLLEEDQVGAVVGEDAGDPLRPEPAIDPDRPVDVVGDDPYPLAQLELLRLRFQRRPPHRQPLDPLDVHRNSHAGAVEGDVDPPPCVHGPLGIDDVALPVAAAGREVAGEGEVGEGAKATL